MRGRLGRSDSLEQIPGKCGQRTPRVRGPVLLAMLSSSLRIRAISFLASAYSTSHELPGSPFSEAGFCLGFLRITDQGQGGDMLRQRFKSDAPSSPAVPQSPIPPTLSFSPDPKDVSYPEIVTTWMRKQSIRPRKGKRPLNTPTPVCLRKGNTTRYSARSLRTAQTIAAFVTPPFPMNRPCARADSTSPYRWAGLAPRA